MRPFDEHGMFRSVTHDGGLRRLAIRSAGVTMFAQGLFLTVQIISTVVLARLLTPQDFGIVTMVTTFSILLVSVGQIGFPEAVLQREHIDHFLISNLFWINVSIGLLLTGGFALAGSLLARFYGNPQIENVAIGVSLSIFLTSISVLHVALLKRAMRFFAVSVNDILARIISVAVSIYLAWAGWGYWALVAGALAQPLATCIGTWTICRWVPGLPRRVVGTGSMVRFAIHVNGSWNFGYFSRNFDNLLVGWWFGSGPLGFYKKAYELFDLPSSQLFAAWSVAVSTLSRLQRDTVRYRRYFLEGLSILAFVGMGLGANLTLVGKDLVRLVLGPGWEASGEMFMYFGPGIGIMLIYHTYGIIHLSIGTTARFFRWKLLEFIVTALLFFLALPWGPIGIAIAWSVSFWILMVPAFRYAGRPIQLGFTPVFVTVWRYCLASLLAYCACDAIIRGIPALAGVSGLHGAMARMVTASLLFGTLYICAVILLHRGCGPISQCADFLREIVPWERFSKSSKAVVGAIQSSGSNERLSSPTIGEKA